MVNPGPPNINFISNSTVLLEGKKIQLICISTNDPDAINPLKVTWYNSNGIQLAKLDLKHVSVYDEPVDETASQVKSVITFDPVKYFDTGKYTTNNAGNRNQTTKTNVLVNVCGTSINYYYLHT